MEYKYIKITIGKKEEEKIATRAGHRCLTTVILATWEAEIGRITI
jgi:hypothetical protein